METDQTIEVNNINGLLQRAVNERSIEEKQLPLSKKNKSIKKQRITVQISEEVIERVKNSVYWTPGLTLASLAEEAFVKAVDALENEREAPFPKRKEELKTGRPIS